MNDLREVLLSAVPEPDRALHPEALLRTARRRRRTQQAVVAAAVALVAVTASLVAALPGRLTGHQLAQAPVTVSALQQRFPLARELVTGASAPVHPGEGSLVATVGDVDVWLVEDTADEVCLLLDDARYGSSGSVCVPRADLLTTGLTMSGRGLRATDPWYLVVVAPDGYEHVMAGTVTAPVVHDVAVLLYDRLPAGDATLTGRGLPTVVLPLQHTVGDAVATGVVPRAGTGGAEAAARLALAQVLTLSLPYAAEHDGRSDGFLAALGTGYPDLRRRLQLTDTTAVARYGDTCLTTDLRTGFITEAQC